MIELNIEMMERWIFNVSGQRRTPGSFLRAWWEIWRRWNAINQGYLAADWLSGCRGLCVKIRLFKVSWEHSVLSTPLHVLARRWKERGASESTRITFIEQKIPPKQNGVLKLELISGKNGWAKWIRCSTMRRWARTIRHVSMQYSASFNFQTLTFDRLVKGLKCSIPFIQFPYTARFNESRPSEKTNPSF